MTLTWMPPRTLKREDSVYPQVRHWLVNEEGRVLAAVIPPARDNDEDSFDARLFWTMTDDTAYFISLEHAQAWCVKRAIADHAAEEKKKTLAPAAATLEVPK